MQALNTRKTSILNGIKTEHNEARMELKQRTLPHFTAASPIKFK